MFIPLAILGVDFATENWTDRLRAGGLNTSRKTLFLWEDVTLYQSESQVRNTMQQVRALSPAGSILLADIYANSFVEGLGKRSGVKATLEMTDETLTFGLPRI